MLVANRLVGTKLMDWCLGNSCSHKKDELDLRTLGSLVVPSDADAGSSLRVGRHVTHAFVQLS